MEMKRAYFFQRRGKIFVSADIRSCAIISTQLFNQLNFIKQHSLHYCSYDAGSAEFKPPVACGIHPENVSGNAGFCVILFHGA